MNKNVIRGNEIILNEVRGSEHFLIKRKLIQFKCYFKKIFYTETRLKFFTNICALIWILSENSLLKLDPFPQWFQVTAVKSQTKNLQCILLWMLIPEKQLAALDLGVVSLSPSLGVEIT